MVNDSVGVVTGVLVNGTTVWVDRAATEALGRDNPGVALGVAWLCGRSIW